MSHLTPSILGPTHTGPGWSVHVEYGQVRVELTTVAAAAELATAHGLQPVDAPDSTWQTWHGRIRGVPVTVVVRDARPPRPPRALGHLVALTLQATR